MKNPNGPYPGRQLFIGIAVHGPPAFAYVVTGRSPASRERRAITRDNTVIMGPIGNTPYDVLRHYTAIKYDNASGIVAVSNGIQTEAIYEAYRLLHNVGTPPTTDFIEKLMDGAKSEPDSMNTPRIAAVITKTEKGPEYIIAIKRHDMPAKSIAIKGDPGALSGISTYQGDMENPTGYDVSKGPSKIPVKGMTPQAIAQFVYDMSAAEYKGDDIRVCAVAGLYVAGKWELAVINRFQ